LISAYGLPAADANLIAAEVAFADLFEAAVKAGADARPAANWVIGEVAPSGKLPSAAVLADIVKMVSAGSITRDQGREVLTESLGNGRSPAEIVAERGFAQDSDEASVKAVVEAVIAANPRAVEDYRAGKKQALGALMADLKKRAPQANPKVASDLLQQLLT
jgi:aspartyl-tRNA(Asn)/glutamyl-tRNA(Gln) amidotransferase subunit B